MRTMLYFYQSSILGHFDIVNFLMEEGAMLDSNFLEKFGNDLLCRAAASADYKAFKLITEKGIKIENNADEDKCPVLLSARCNQYEMVQLLYTYGGADIKPSIVKYGAKLVTKAALDDKYEAVRFLVENGTRINSKFIKKFGYNLLSRKSRELYF